MPRMTMLRLMILANNLAVTSWPEGPKIRWVMAKFSRFTNRVISGAVAGIVVGSLSSIIGIALSGADFTDATTFKELVGLVALSAGVWAVVLACFFDFTHLYLRLLRTQHSRWDSNPLAKDKMRDGDIDGLFPKSRDGHRELSLPNE